MQVELARWSNLPPEEIGIAVISKEVAETVLLSIWKVEVSGKNGERLVVIQIIAVKQDGTRIPLVERQNERYMLLPPSQPKLTPEERLDMFSRIVEPTLQRELKHKGAVNAESSYSAELIGYVEVVA